MKKKPSLDPLKSYYQISQLSIEVDHTYGDDNFLENEYDVYESFIHSPVINENKPKKIRFPNYKNYCSTPTISSNN